MILSINTFLSNCISLDQLLAGAAIVFVISKFPFFPYPVITIRSLASSAVRTTEPAVVPEVANAASALFTGFWFSEFNVVTTLTLTKKRGYVILC